MANVHRVVCDLNLIHKSSLDEGSATVLVIPSLDFASQRLWWIVELLEAVYEQLLVQSWHSQLWSLHIDSFTVRLLCLIVPNVVSSLLEMVQIPRTDLQHEDDSIVHF